MAPLEPLGDLVREQLAHPGEQVGERNRAPADLAQVDDPGDLHRAALVGQRPALKGLEEPTDHRRLADPSATNDVDHSQAAVAEVLPDLSGLHMTILEPGGRQQGRREHELGAAGNRSLHRLPLTLQAASDAFFGADRGGTGVLDEPLLVAYATFQIPDLILDQRPAGTVGSREFPSGVAKSVPEFPQRTFRGASPPQMRTEPSQAPIETPDEVNELPGAQPERQFGIGLGTQRDYRLFVLQREHPFVLALGLVGHAVGRHHEQQSTAFADRPHNLDVPLVTRVAAAGHPAIPRTPGGRPLQRLRQPESELFVRFDPRMADEIMISHRPHPTQVLARPGPKRPAIPVRH